MSKHAFRVLPKATPPKTVVMQDPYGNELAPGQRVAYNYQGQVRLGVILKVNRATINIARIDPQPRPGKLSYSSRNSISKVTSPRNLVVLHSILTDPVEVEDGSDDDE